MKDFCKGMRNMANALVCELLGCDLPEDELDEYVKLGVVHELVLHYYQKPRLNKKTGNKRKARIADQDVDKVIEILADDIYQSMLSKMAAADMVEVCWSSKTESFHLYKKKLDNNNVRHLGEELGLGLAEYCFDDEEEEKNDD
jgi:hypothetical protein